MDHSFWHSISRGLFFAKKSWGNWIMFKKNKKGELTTKQLVTIIVLITSFIIVLLLFFRLDLGQTTDKEVCRNSVTLAGQAKLASGPLDCRTNYLCISGGNTCDSLSQTSEIEVDPEDKNQILMAIADEMSDCWWQFGEGKVNYGDTALFEKRVEYALCSIVAFDDEVQGKVSEIGYQEFYEYLRTAQKSQSQTYLQYLYGTNVLQGIDSEDLVKFSLGDKIFTSDRYVIVTGINNNLNPTPEGDQVLNVYIIPFDEIDSRLHSDREFITKA